MALARVVTFDGVSSDRMAEMQTEIAASRRKACRRVAALDLLPHLVVRYLLTSSKVTTRASAIPASCVDCTCMSKAAPELKGVVIPSSTNPTA